MVNISPSIWLAKVAHIQGKEKERKKERFGHHEVFLGPRGGHQGPGSLPPPPPAHVWVGDRLTRP